MTKQRRECMQMPNRATGYQYNRVHSNGVAGREIPLMSETTDGHEVVSETPSHLYHQQTSGHDLY